LNNIISTKTTSSIFLAALLVLRTIATILPSAQPQPYYRDTYEPDYGKDSYEKKPYENSYESNYGKDNYKFKDNNVSLKKLKCNNINANLNNVDANFGSPGPSDGTDGGAEWLLGHKQLSGSYNCKIKSQIKKKLENFESFELPLLIERGLLSFSTVTKFGNGVTKYGNAQIDSLLSNNDSHHFPAKIQSLGREFQYDSTLLDSRPFPYQEGKKINEAKILLDIPFKLAIRYWKQYLKSRDMFEAFEFYKEHSYDIPTLLSIITFMKKNNIYGNNIVNVLRTANDVSNLNQDLSNLKAEIEKLKIMKNNYLLNQNTNYQQLLPLGLPKYYYEY
jgi:hypothetical protein